MLQFNQTTPVSQFVASKGIKSIAQMNLENGKSYLKADNGITMKTSAEALSRLAMKDYANLAVSSCNDTETDAEEFFMLHVVTSQGTIAKTFTF